MEFRVFGPPGTGKTTYIVSQIERALKKYSRDEIYVCSFTRAAAVEIVSRVSGVRSIPERNIGTIHALCLRSMGGNVRVAEGDQGLTEEWNSRYGSYWRIGKATSIDEPDYGDAKALSIYNRERMQLSPRRMRPDFVSYWEKFKNETGAIDYTDMLLNAPDELPDCKVLFVDEAQDLTPLQWQIVRRWGANAETFIVCGDDDQLLYQFTGADVKSFLSPIPDDRIRVLSQSWRLPKAIHEYSQKHIARLGNRRQRKEFSPKTGEVGKVEHSAYTYLEPETWINNLSGKNMLLFSCSYMAKSVISILRNKGIPFYNPYRTNRGDWNPLAKGSKNLVAVSSISRSFSTGGIGTLDDWKSVAKLLSAKNNIANKKALSEREKPFGDVDQINEFFFNDAMRAVIYQDMDWLQANMTATAERATQYPLSVWRKHGPGALTKVPDIIIGTIHSVKGGEADTVYLFPDLPYAAMKDPANSDAIIRQMYVGMTRAKQTLVMCQPSGKYYYD